MSVREFLDPPGGDITMKVFSLGVHMDLMGNGKTINVDVDMIPIWFDIPQNCCACWDSIFCGLQQCFCVAQLSADKDLGDHER